MNHGILQTALMGLPLELQYRPPAADDHTGALFEPIGYSTDLVMPQTELTLNDEFAALAGTL